MQTIAEKLKTIYEEMQNVDDIKTWDNSKTEFLSQIEDLQYDIDALPSTEKEPKNKEDRKAIEFNKKHFKARDIKNKLQDIQELLYYTNLSNEFSYYEKVIYDPALNARLDNIIERCEKKGQIIPLPAEFQNLQVEEATLSVETEVEYSDIKELEKETKTEE